jgi:GTPase
MGIDKKTKARGTKAQKTKELIRKLKQGDQSALARAITLLEEGELDVVSLEDMIGNTGKSYRIGFTGPPGAGKSSLIDWLLKHIRSTNAMAGVLATDPSSPFTGGAILGDRIRMQHHFLDQRVFIRSLGSRGAKGGISRIARDASYLMQAAGYKFIIIETVGVGQTELDIMNIADAVVVVLVPESGDVVQTMKAGLMEIANIFVVNKADREGSKQMVNALNFIIETSRTRDTVWQIPILLTNALDGTGTEELFQTILKYREFLDCDTNTDLFLRKRLHELQQIAVEQTGAHVENAIKELSTGKFKSKLKDPSFSIYRLLREIMHKKEFLNNIFK